MLERKSSDDPTDEVKFRQDLRSETGFGTYVEWLNQYPQDYPHLLSLRRRREFSVPFCCALVDLSNCEDSSIAINALDEGTTGVASSAPALLYDLRHPTQNICLRVLLWWVNPSDPITPELLDVCGLGLKIGPQFFGTLAELADRGVRPFQPGQSQHYTAIGTQVVTIARNYISDRADPPPVLVIVDWDDRDRRDDDLQLHESSRQAISDWCLDETPPFQYPIVFDVPPENVPRETESKHGRSRVYTTSLGQLLKRTDCAAIRATDLLLLSMMPLLHIDTLQMRAKTRSLRRRTFSAFTSKSSNLAEYGVMKDERFWLRRHIEDSEAGKNNFVKYLRAQDGNFLLGEAQYLDIDGLWRDALDEARMLETEVRDSTSIEVGQLSLKESRKSIELSNHQIVESRRVRIITVLAFIYVPFTTVTSIYGMNIQQINGSGHSIWIFIVTAAIALLATGYSWNVIESHYRVKAWYARSDEAVPRGRFKHRLAFRLFMIFWLIRKGHSRWMWKTKAWWLLITNTNSALWPYRTYKTPPELDASVCDYVAYFARRPDSHSIDAFPLYRIGGQDDAPTRVPTFEA